MKTWLDIGFYNLQHIFTLQTWKCCFVWITWQWDVIPHAEFSFKLQRHFPLKCTNFFQEVISTPGLDWYFKNKTVYPSVFYGLFYFIVVCCEPPWTLALKNRVYILKNNFLRKSVSAVISPLLLPQLLLEKTGRIGNGKDFAYHTSKEESSWIFILAPCIPGAKRNKCYWWVGRCITRGLILFNFAVLTQSPQWACPGVLQWGNVFPQSNVFYLRAGLWLYGNW